LPIAAYEAPRGGDPLQRCHPTYPDSARNAFAFDVPRAALAGGAPRRFIRVRNRLRVTTEIDRRCLTPCAHQFAGDDQA